MRGPPSDRQLYPPSRQEADRGIAAPALHHAGQPGKLQRYYSGRPRGVIFWLRLKNQPGPVRTRLAFQPLCEVTRSRPRPARTWPLAGVCLVGLRVPNVAPGQRGPRRVAPVRRAGRSTVHRWAGCAMTGAGLLGRGSERDRHHRPGAVSSLHGMARATRPHLQPRPAIEPTQEVHLYGVPADVAAICGQEGLPGPNLEAARPPGTFGKRSWEPAVTRPGAVCAAGSHGYLV